MNPVILRRVQIALLVVGLAVTTMGLVMIIGSYRDDARIDANQATVSADVISADSVHAAVNFQTPDGQFHSPRLGLLYPTELAQGQRIRVEYDRADPDLARPAGRNWTLAILPAVSVVVVGWVIVAGVMILLAEVNRRRLRRKNAPAAVPPRQDSSTDRESPETSKA